MPEELSRWYRGRLILGPFTPFNIEELQTLEREIGLPLPTAYRSFLETAGGNGLEYSVGLPDCEPEPLQSFNDLHRLGCDSTGEYGYDSLLGEYRHGQASWLAGQIDLAGLLPIARNGGSDTLFLDLNPATSGQLCAFIHGIPWPGRLQQGVFTHVADDFDAYLDNLVIDPELAEDAWSDVSDSDPTDPWRRTVEQWLDKDMAGWRSQPWATH